MKRCSKCDVVIDRPWLYGDEPERCDACCDSAPSHRYAVGDAVICNGFPGTVTARDVTPGGCMEVRLASGVCVVDPDDELTVRPALHEPPPDLCRWVMFHPSAHPRFYASRDEAVSAASAVIVGDPDVAVFVARIEVQS